MLRNKILFALNRYKYEENKILLNKNLFFLTSSTSFPSLILFKRSLSLFVKEEIIKSSNKSLNLNFLTLRSFRGRILLISREIKKRK